MEYNLLVAFAILLLMFVIGLAMLTRRRKSHRLANRFGPEYDRTVQRMGRRPAEAELAAREKRVHKLDILPLAPHEAQRFRMEWHSLQGRFGDTPRTAVAEADLLVRDVMMRRGYPMGEFEACAADLGIDHPHVVAHYRAAHAIALRDRREQVDTGMLRQAVVHYRALFDDLLASAPATQTRREAPRNEARRSAAVLRPERAMAHKEASPRDRERQRER
jgi:hypothetical protein